MPTKDPKPESPKPDRAKPDKSPQGDLRQALTHLQKARGKFIMAGNEDSGSRALDVIEIVKDMLPEFNVNEKTEAA